MLGDHGERNNPSVRPRPTARHFSSFLAENASKKFGHVVSSATANEVEQRPVPKKKAAADVSATPLQLLFQSIWKRVQEVCKRSESSCFGMLQ